MKKQIIKITILINIIIVIIAGNAVQAANTTTSNKTNTNSTSNITSTSIAGTSNAKLANLGLKKYDFSGFKPDETSYEVTIPEDVTEVEVYAKTQDTNATYKVTGDTNLKKGTNKVTITVTAADGKTKKEYYINVRRLGVATEEEEEKTETEDTESIDNQAQSSITNYSEPHVEYGWYIIGISLSIVTVLLIIFIIIDDYEKPEKKKVKKSKYIEDEDEQFEGEAEEETEELEEQSNYNIDSQATKVLNLDEIKNMKSKPSSKGKHF